jgi:hypothetical protein
VHQSKHGDAGVLCGRKDKRIAEIEIQGHQTTLFKLTRIQDRSVGRASQAFAMHSLDVMTRLSKEMGRGVPEVLVKRQSQEGVSKGIST